MKLFNRSVFGLVLATVLFGGLPRLASAQGFSINIKVNESGAGSLSNTAGFNAPLPTAMTADPGPGGLSSALTYDLLNPPGLVAGDLILMEPGLPGIISDIIRFNPSSFTGGSGSLVFYSDNLDGVDSPADTGFPTALYANNLTVNEVGPEGSNGYVYTPTAGQPGFVSGAGGPVTYEIYSDVPEPGSLGLLATGGLPLLGLLRRRRITA